MLSLIVCACTPHHTYFRRSLPHPPPFFVLFSQTTRSPPPPVIESSDWIRLMLLLFSDLNSKLYQKCFLVSKLLFWVSYRIYWHQFVLNSFLPRWEHVSRVGTQGATGQYSRRKGDRRCHSHQPRSTGHAQGRWFGRFGAFSLSNRIGLDVDEPNGQHRDDQRW